MLPSTPAAIAPDATDVPDDLALREQRIIDAIRATVSKRLHAEADALTGDLVADILVALLIDEPPAAPVAPDEWHGM